MSAKINRGAPLTPREVEVQALLAKGLSNKLIADQLDITDHTVKFFVNVILKKLGAASRTEAGVLYAVKEAYDRGYAKGFTDAVSQMTLESAA